MCYLTDRFRLRRHSNQKHPHLPIKWIDLTTSEVCFDPQKLPASVADSSSSVSTTSSVLNAQPLVRKQTARKSTTGRHPMQVALFRSGKFSARSQLSDRDAIDLDSDSEAEQNGDLRIAENDDEIDISNDEDGKGADEEIEVDDSMDDENQSSAVYIDCDVDSDGDVAYVPRIFTRFCCHLCSFTVLAPISLALADHLNRKHHSVMCRLPAVEILDFDAENDDGASPMLLRRCGFCSFESFVGTEFDDHVLSVHGLPRPLRCNRGCMYASFSRLQMHAHFVETHSRETVSVSPLDKPYSMLPYEEDSAEDNDDISVTFAAKVVLEDVFEFPDAKFDALLNAHGVWY